MIADKAIRVLTGAILISAFSCGDLWAADTALAPASADASAGGLEEVVVTANRRRENLQTVPITVTAITAETAERMGITDTQSLANAVPGLTWDRATATAVPFLRGVGSPVGQVSAEPSVSMYVDDVYVPASGASLANFNTVSSIEVEKGPQGTLFGRNATGGVIQIFTKNPTKAPELNLDVGYANYNTPSGSIYATGGLGQNFAANISLYGGDQGDGWGTNVTTGNDAFKNNRYYGGRVKFDWTPSDTSDLLLAFDYDNTKSSQGFYRPQYGTVGAGFYPSPSGFYDLVDWTDPFWVVKQWGASLKFTDEWNWGKFVSITAYRDTVQQQLFDQSGGPFAIVRASINGPDRTITQEFQLLSTHDSPLTWITGLYYMHDSSGYQPLSLEGLAVAPLVYGNIFSEQITKSYAVFADVTWSFLPTTRLTGGLRYTWDDRSITSGYILGLPPDGTPLPETTSNSPQSSKTDKLTGRMSLSHDFTSDFMGYIAFNRGFKSGTFNAVVFPGAPIGAPVQPETLDAYSIGEKAEFLNHRLRVNTEGFWYDYRNIQVTEIVPGGTALRNAAKATIKGVDLDVTFAATEHLSLSAGLEYLDGHYDDFPNGLFWIYAPNPAAGVSNVNPAVAPNLKGNKTIDTPPFTAAVRVNYLMPTTAGPLNFAISYNHGGNYYFDADNGQGQITPALDKQKTLNLVNASIDWTSLSGRYDVRLWGKNVFGQKYISFGFEEALLTQFGPAPPATYGINVGFHFR
jgi:iron complex outermembrane recepter protein